MPAGYSRSVGERRLPIDLPAENILRLTEIQFVEILRRRAGRHAREFARGRALRRGIGDDCAVIAQSSRNDLLVTTDLFLEGVHFRREWQDPDSAGHKALARGLSDIAAMGGTPRYAFLSLGLPPDLGANWVDEFFRGLFKLASDARVILAGGDTGRSRSGFVADIIVVGEVPKGRAVLRSGARVGDEIWVTGRLGLAAVGLEALEHRTARERKSVRYAEALQRFYYPQPRLRAGRYLRERELVSAMIDLSDGLSIDLARLCQESGVGARVDESALPRNPETPVRLALHGGEDLELLFTVPPGLAHALPRSIAGVKLTRIGQVIRMNEGKSGGKKAGSNLMLVRGNKEMPMPVLGFQHF